MAVASTTLEDIEVIAGLSQKDRRDRAKLLDIAERLGLEGTDHLSTAQILAFLEDRTKESKVQFNQGGDIQQASFKSNPIPPKLEDGEFKELDPEEAIQLSREPGLKDVQEDFKQKLKRATDALGNTKATPEVTVPKAKTEDPPDFHPDRPVDSSQEDDLGRAAVAEAVVKNVIHVWADQKEHSRPFAIHLSGRWGSGKSSILNFLREKLEAETSQTPTSSGTTNHGGPKGWVVVDYNAWRMQGVGPAWWTLRNAVVDAGEIALGPEGIGFAFRDRLWKFKQVMQPWLIVIFVLLGLLALWLFAGNDDLTTKVLETKTVTIENPDDITTVTTTETTKGLVDSPDPLFGTATPWAFLAGIASLLTAVGVLITFLRGFTRTSTQTAEAIQSLQSDPTETLKNRFAEIIEDIERPVAVFIDDLDRCDAPFVVELLQALQTIYADVPVLYVVAADRDWIVSAYNQTYEGFESEISRPGSPLGYLFLKKIFQLSINVPDLSQTDVDKLTRVLLNSSNEEATEQVKTAQRADFKKKIAAAEGNLDALSALAPEIHRSAVAKEIAPDLLGAVISSKGQEAIRHALLDHVEYFDGNPRAIKRLVNALTFRQGYILIAGGKIDFKTVARWTILDLRFPYTAAALSRDPDKILKKNRNIGTPTKPGPDAEFFHDDAIDKILEGLKESDIDTISQFG